MHVLNSRVMRHTTAWCAVLMLLSAAAAQPADAAEGYYNGLKLPYIAGAARIVVRTTSHGPGRHAVDFGLIYEPVLAMYGGRVVVASQSVNEGRYVVIDHGDGYCANYLHFDKVQVRAGQRVQQGEVLGISGNTGKSTGPHLHAAVFRKVTASCTGAGAGTEVMLLFDEFPSRELRAGDWIVSRNGRPTAPYYPSVDIAASDSLLVKWNDYSNNEDGFKIERRTGAKGAWAQVGTVGENATNLRDAGLAPSTQFCYRMRAFNRAGDSTYSNITCASTLARGSAPVVLAPPTAPQSPPAAGPLSPAPGAEALDTADSAPGGEAFIYNGLLGLRILMQQIGLLSALPDENDGE
ncbi:MAG: peptidoglycan DD-metalloendopeptidase family protein [Chloroflexi bacterium]|nr:peptidoglycan DD-metalloendopeptidase family protein [Chloroflexota bacterium]